MQQLEIQITDKTVFANPSVVFLLLGSQSQIDLELIESEFANCKQLSREQMRQMVVNRESYVLLNPKLVQLFAMHQKNGWKNVQVLLPKFAFSNLIPLRDEKNNAILSII